MLSSKRECHLIVMKDRQLIIATTDPFGYSDSAPLAEQKAVLNCCRWTFSRCSSQYTDFLQYPGPLATWLRVKKEIVCNQKCRLADFWRKRKWCGTTSLPFSTTRGFSAKKEVVWRDLPAIFHHSAKKEGGWRNLKNLPEILYFFVDQYRLNAFWMLPWEMSIGNDWWV